MPGAIYGLAPGPRAQRIPLAMTVSVDSQIIAPTAGAPWSVIVGTLQGLLTSTGETQMNNRTAIGHWLQIDFSRPYRLSSIGLTARAGGAGAGATTWITSNGQIVSQASIVQSGTATVTFDGSLVTWVRMVFTSSNTNFDGWTRIAPATTFAGPLADPRRLRPVSVALTSDQQIAHGLDNSWARRPLVITPSIDGNWTGSALSNLIDLNDATEVQANNQSVVGHFVQFNFSRPVRLRVVRAFCRGGGAGSGAMTWITDDGQSAGMTAGTSTAKFMLFSGTPVSWVRGTWTTNQSNFDGLGEVTFYGPLDEGRYYYAPFNPV